MLIHFKSIIGKPIEDALLREEAVEIEDDTGLEIEAEAGGGFCGEMRCNAIFTDTLLLFRLSLYVATVSKGILEEAIT